MKPSPERPNILFINVDQLSMAPIGAHGSPHVHTPNIDRLVRQGTSFRESHCADPICCPARASWFTGRMSSEHAVVFNNTPIRKDVPDLGRWLRDRGYETVHSGKWHVPGRSLPNSFDLVYGEHWSGEYADESVVRATEAYLRNRTSSAPFFLVVGLLQPHDCCYWAGPHEHAPANQPFPEILDELPPLPPNFTYEMAEPELAKQQGSHRIGLKHRPITADWSEETWRYYVWSYYRDIEMVDATVGHMLDALEDSGYADNTIIILASDHGDGHAHHRRIMKEYLYDEIVKVPLIVSCPGRLPEDEQDTTHLVSGVDLLPTVCDFAGVEPPPHQRGRSLRPLLEGRADEWREFVAAECFITGRLIRTPQFKYVTYKGDPVEQLFDLENDPWEMTNLATEAQYDSVLHEHQKLLSDWESHLDPAPVPSGGWLQGG
jgi:choline-sulfatase